MSTLNYSKWDHIEVSDDEDDTHPNIDTPSLFRWRHQARLERDVAWENEKQEFEIKYKEYQVKYNVCRQKLNAAKEQNDVLKTGALETEMEKLEIESKEWTLKEKEIEKKGRYINSAKLEQSNSEKDTSEEAALKRLKEFVQKHGKDIKKFGIYQRPTDSKQYLIENPHLVCEDTANELVLWCIDLAMEEKIDLMNHVSHQCILMQFMLELAKSLKCDPRACIRPFFAKFVNPEPEYQKAFNDELFAFRDRIKARAKVRLEEAMIQIEEEEKQKRLGPGGLDPVEVFDTLPQILQTCFETKDVERLKTVLCNMDPKDAEYHMKRCVDSGLWVDNVKLGDTESGGVLTEEIDLPQSETVEPDNA